MQRWEIPLKVLKKTYAGSHGQKMIERCFNKRKEILYLQATMLCSVLTPMKCQTILFEHFLLQKVNTVHLP